MENLFDSIKNYDRFISQLNFSIQILETFKEKIDYKTIVHQTKVFMESLKKQNMIANYTLLSNKSDMCNLKNGILTIIQIKIDSNYKIKTEQLKQLYKLYNLDFKYSIINNTSRIINVEFKFEEWLKDSFKD